MDEYTTNLGLLTEIRILIKGYLDENSFDSDTDYINVMTKIYENSIIINRYINLMKPDPEEQVKCIKYFKIWPNVPPNISLGTYVIDLLAISRSALDNSNKTKISFLKLFGDIRKDHTDEDLKDIFQLLQISDMKDLYIREREMEIKTKCEAIFAVVEGYLKVMTKYKTELVSLCEKDESSSQMTFF